MSVAKFTEGARVRVYVDGRLRNGRVSGVSTGAKRGTRRSYTVSAESGGRNLGTFISKELQPR